MKKGYKTRLCLLLVLCMAALFLPQSLAKEQPATPTDLSEQAPLDGAASLQQDLPVALAYEKTEYSENDVNVINAMIDNTASRRKKTTRKTGDLPLGTTAPPHPNELPNYIWGIAR